MEKLLFITRWQPITPWHIDAIRQWIELWIKKIFLWIWSSNKELTAENPFSYEQRKEMTRIMLMDCLSWIEFEIFPIPDVWENSKWIKYIEDNIPSFDLLVTWNVWVSDIFKQKWVQILSPNQRVEVKASYVRKRIAQRNFEKLKSLYSENFMKYLNSINAFDTMKLIFKEMLLPITEVSWLIFIQNKVVLIQKKQPPFWYWLPWCNVSYWESLENSLKKMFDEVFNKKIKIKVKKIVWVGEDLESDWIPHTINIVYLVEIIYWSIEDIEWVEWIKLLDMSEINNQRLIYWQEKLFF